MNLYDNKFKEKKIFITGSRGLFGKSLIKFLKNKKIKFTAFNRKNDISYDKYYFIKLFKRNKISHVINLAAYTDVDDCEKKKRICKKINVNFTKILCDAISLTNPKIKLIHFSTDQMYSNYRTNIERNAKAINSYTRCKIESEAIALKINSIVIRTNFFGKSINKKRMSFLDWIYYSLKNKKKISLADDLFFSPISIKNLIKIVLKIMLTNKKGVYNIGSHNGFSKYHFGYLISKYTGMNIKYITKVKMKNLKFFAKRHSDMRMRLTKFEQRFKIKLPKLKNELLDTLKLYNV